jgi:prepilin-type N-terminal cleavage/methylation domain-containing protein
MKRNNNKGFSLVEMIVAMAILSFVGIGVVTFLATSTKSYTSVSQSASVQEEAQTSIGQIVTMLQNAEMGITGTDKSTDHYLYIYNEGYRYVIKQSGTKLYYLKQDIEEDSATNTYTFSDPTVEPESSKFSLLAENVKEETFSATEVTANNASHTVINVYADFEKSSSSTADYSVSQNVVLRNSIQLTANYSDLYGTPDSPVVKTTYSNLTVTLANDGTQQTFSYNPASGGYAYVIVKKDITDPISLNYSVNVSYSGPNPDPTYNAELSTEGTMAEGTVMDTTANIIYIGTDQKDDLSLNVNLVKKSSMALSIPVKIVRVNDITIKCVESFSSLCNVGNTIALDSSTGISASVTGTNLDISSWQSVTWAVEISDGTGTETVSLEGCSSYTIPDDAEGKTITFIATSAIDSAVSSRSESYTINKMDKITLTKEWSTLNRGSSNDFDVENGLGTSYREISDYQTNLEYEVRIVNNRTGTELTDKSGISINKTDFMLTISTNNSLLDYNSSFTVYVTVKDNSLGITSNTITFEIPAVTVEFYENSTYSDMLTAVTMYTTDHFVPGTSNQYKVEAYYKINGISLSEGDAPTFTIEKVSNLNVSFDVSNRWFDSANDKGRVTFTSIKPAAINNQKIATGYVTVKETKILTKSLDIYSTKLSDHSLTINVTNLTFNSEKSAYEALRGSEVIVEVKSKDTGTEDETIVDISSLDWTFMDGDKAYNWEFVSGSNSIQLPANLSYNSEHTITFTATDGEETASVSLTVPKVTIDYKGDQTIYLCSDANKISDSSETGKFEGPPGNTMQNTYQYSKEVAYKISGFASTVSVKISGFNNINSDNNYFNFVYNSGTFTVKSKGNDSSHYPKSGNAKIKVPGYDENEITNSTFTINDKQTYALELGTKTYYISTDTSDDWTWYIENNVSTFRYYVYKHVSDIYCVIYYSSGSGQSKKYKYRYYKFENDVWKYQYETDVY